jgi:hypothetical protein
MLCTLTRWKISNALDNDGSLSPMAKKHLERCSACTRYQKRLGTLDQTLALGAPGARPPMPQKSKRLAPALLITGGLAAATALALALFVTRGSSDDTSASMPPRSRHSVSKSEFANAKAPPKPISDDSAGRIAAKAQAIAAANPLERELSALMSDSKRGLRAALNVSGLRTLDREIKR